MVMAFAVRWAALDRRCPCRTFAIPPGASTRSRSLRAGLQFVRIQSGRRTPNPWMAGVATQKPVISTQANTVRAAVRRAVASGSVPAAPRPALHGNDHHNATARQQ